MFMVVAATDGATIAVAAISAVSAVLVALISAWAAIQVSRATTRQATTVAGLESDKTQLQNRVRELEERTRQ